MPDKGELLKARIGKLGLAPGREEEILRELSEHLQDHASALAAGGVSSEEAAREALDSVSDWPGLRRDIVLAETEETTMNYRTKVLWLPVLCAIALSYGLLAIIPKFGSLPHFYWLSPDLSMGPYFAFLVPWLISQPVVGAVGAYWSRRAGGALLHRLLAALAPAIALLGLFLVILPFSMIPGGHIAANLRLRAFWAVSVSWVLLPSLPLLAGAAPFLRKPQSQS